MWSETCMHTSKFRSRLSHCFSQTFLRDSPDPNQRIFTSWKTKVPLIVFAFWNCISNQIFLRGNLDCFKACKSANKLLGKSACHCKIYVIGLYSILPFLECHPDLVVLWWSTLAILSSSINLPMAVILHRSSRLYPVSNGWPLVPAERAMLLSTTSGLTSFVYHADRCFWSWSSKRCSTSLSQGIR